MPEFAVTVSVGPPGRPPAGFVAAPTAIAGTFERLETTATPVAQFRSRSRLIIRVVSIGSVVVTSTPAPCVDRDGREFAAPGSHSATIPEVLPTEGTVMN
ncbi:hypothetical protein GCM10023094_45100 [Rhodococcus olei]|uniref:Uncharacterized protein n=1 Tax=Rhodococcus olei TaxID=2161675 RepID=A0ABP8PI97_9NOCA